MYLNKLDHLYDCICLKFTLFIRSQYLLHLCIDFYSMIINSRIMLKEAEDVENPEVTESKKSSKFDVSSKRFRNTCLIQYF